MRRAVDDSSDKRLSSQGCACHLHVSPLGTAVKDLALTASCNPPADRPPTPPGVLCGDYAVNTIQPAFQPYAPGTPETRRLPAQTAPHHR